MSDPYPYDLTLSELPDNYWDPPDIDPYRDDRGRFVKRWSESRVEPVVSSSSPEVNG